MEFASKIKWAVVVFLLLFVLVFAGWGLSSIARSIFNSPSSDNSTEQVMGVNADNFDSVSFTVDGPVVASENHKRYTITVSSRVVSMKVYSDYGQNVLQEKSYTNNSEAYETLVQALSKADAISRIKNTDTIDDYDEQGSCPTGQRYILELGDIERRWSTSCKTVKGTAGGQMTTIRSLFSSQVPDYKELVKDTKLSR